MSRVRPAAVAGQFYPEEPRALRSMVRDCLKGAARASRGAPKILIAPHAGFVYSGPIAGSGYARIEPLREQIERVVLVGPAHRVYFRGLALPSVEAFETPLGAVELDREATRRVLALPQVAVSSEAHAFEHSLEVHLPFLQETLDEFRLVPLVVGDTTAEQVAEVLKALWGGPETLIVVSSDLSHYHDYATAARMDRATTRAIETLRPEAIAVDDACGRIPIQGLLLAAREHGLRLEAVDVRSSGDTAGPRERVVGYGAYVGS